MIFSPDLKAYHHARLVKHARHARPTGCAWLRAASRSLRDPLTHSARGGVLELSGRGTSIFTPCLWQVEQGTGWIAGNSEFTFPPPSASVEMKGAQNRMTLEEYYNEHGSAISQESERLFVDEFLYPLLGERIKNVLPQYPFLDRTGRSRRIDFVAKGSRAPLALEVNGETYHAEGIIPNEMFDDNLFRQNEILKAGYRLLRFSYSQLKDARWRPIIMETLRDAIGEAAPELLIEYSLEPNEIQREALDALQFHRATSDWRKGLVVMPTGTGKTILSALDARRVGGRVLFMVHRLDILAQSVSAYRKVWPTMTHGYLTGEVREREHDADVLFASKDTLRQPNVLASFAQDEFDYIVIDEVHHGQSPSYQEILAYFRPKFMLGMTATPDRLDRKDIFELFDYNKAYEVDTSEVIERGFLVPYTYIGLKDDVDYSKIRYLNNRYNVEDLERLLIIPERNEAILKEYLERGNGDKAIGFCVSIKHAERMAEFFNAHGVPSAPIHSQNPARDELVQQFRDNKIAVAFTVDLFNEGVDFPNVQVLMFLRPTESRTVFIQQLGRGLRLAAGKDRVRVLDFIGNYKRASQVREFLAKKKFVSEQADADGRTRRKIEYEYALGCEVQFDPSVEEILDRQDAETLGVSPIELKEAYYAVAESLERKPTRADIDAHGEYKSNVYARVYGSWTKFIKEIGEYTEASYHYPQGTHVGHLLSILWYFGLPTRDGSAFENKFIRFRGGLGDGRISVYRRQLKYKLQAAMELGLIQDERRAPPEGEFYPELTPLGMQLRAALEPHLAQLNLAFPLDADGVPSSVMADNEATYNAFVRDRVAAGGEAGNILTTTVINMHAVQQMMAFLYHIARRKEVEKAFIYENFFEAPFVKQFMDQEGIEEATPEARVRRLPFILNLLDSIGVIDNGRQSVTVNSLVLIPALVKPYRREAEEVARKRLLALKAAWPNGADRLDEADLSILRELFGAPFLTPGQTFNEAQFFEDI